MVEATLVIRMPREKTNVLIATFDSEAGLRNWLLELDKDARKAYTDQRFGCQGVNDLTAK